MKQCQLCTRTSHTHKISQEAGLCTPCEMSLVYWNKKTARQKMKRLKQVESFENRMRVSLGNVRTMKRKRHA